MRIIGVFLLCLSSGLIKSQDVFKKFNSNNEELESYRYIDKETIEKLLEQQKSLYSEIHNNYKDSIVIYYPRFLITMGYVCSRRNIYPIDSLDKYSLKLLKWSDSVNDTVKLVRAFISRSGIYAVTNYEKSERLIKKALFLSLKFNDQDLRLKVITNYLKTYTYAGNYSSGIQMVDRYLSQAIGCNFNSRIFFHIEVGNVYMGGGYLRKSHYHYNLALDYCLESQDSIGLMFVYLPLSNLANFTGNIEGAIEHSNNALALHSKVGPIATKYLTYQLYLSCINNYYSIKALDSTEKYVELAYQDCSLREDSANLISVIFVKALIEIERTRYEKALELIYAYSSYKHQHFDSGPNRACEAALTCHRELGNYDSALYYGFIGLKYYEGLGRLSSVKTFHNLIASIYEHKKDYENYIKHKNLQIVYYDSINKEQKRKEIIKLETQFKVKLIEYEKQQYKLEAEKKEAVNQNNQNIIKNKELIQQSDARTKRFLVFGILGSALLLSLVIMVLLIRNQAKKKQIVLKNTTIQNQQLNERVLRDKLKYFKEQLVLESKWNTIDGIKKKKVKDYSALSQQLKNDNNWRDFMIDFNQTYYGLLDILPKHYPDLTNHDFRIAALTILKLSLKEMGELLVVSEAGITKAKSRLRDKLGLVNSSEIPQFLHQFVDKYCNPNIGLI